MKPRIEATFAMINGNPNGSRFCLFSEPATTSPWSLVAHIPAFTEEMNKSRRMVAMQARALAEDGCAVLQMDLQGCGDSAGDFGEATWQAWRDDVVFAGTLLRERFRSRWPQTALPPLWLWGLRAGCLLAVEAASQLPQPVNFLFWQPAPLGKVALQQFLRMASVGAVFGKTSTGEASPRDRLASGQNVQIAGYELSPGLTDGLEASRLVPPAGGGRVEWLEVGPLLAASPSPATLHAQALWTQAGWRLRHHVVTGPTFWQTTEIEDAPLLIAASREAMHETPPPAVSLLAPSNESA